MVQGLSSAYGGRADHRIDLDALVAQEVTDLTGLPLAQRGQLPVDIVTTGTRVAGLGVPQQDQRTPRRHARSLDRLDN